MDVNKKSDTQKAEQDLGDVPGGPVPGSKVTPGGSEPPASEATPAKASPSSSGRSGKKLVMIIILVLLVLGGGGAAAYFGYYVPNKPQNILKKALVNTFSDPNLKSAYFTGDITSESLEGGLSMSANLNGAANSDGAFSLNGSLSINNAKVTADVRSTDGTNFYLRVGGLEGITKLLGSTSTDTSAQASKSIYSAIDNQWIMLDVNTLSQIGLEIENLNPLKMTKNEAKAVADAYAKNQFLIVNKKLANEKVGSTDSYHFKATVDKTKFKSFVSAVKAAKLANLTITDSQQKSWNASVDKASSSGTPIDLWIAKNTKYIDKVSVTTTSSNTKTTMSLTITDYNKAVNIEKPANAKTLVELIKGVTGRANTGNQLSPLASLQGTSKLL